MLLDPLVGEVLENVCQAVAVMSIKSCCSGEQVHSEASASGRDWD